MVCDTEPMNFAQRALSLVVLALILVSPSLAQEAAPLDPLFPLLRQVWLGEEK